MSEWQPIETAPRDGTLILIYEKRRYDNIRIATGYFYPTNYGGLWYTDFFNEDGPISLDEATYWKPLCEPLRRKA